MNFTVTHRTEATIKPPAYGIWIPFNGWLHSNDPQGNPVYYAEPRKSVAKQVAKRCSKGAKVMYIDQSLIDLEGYFKTIELERGKAAKSGKNVVS